MPVNSEYLKKHGLPETYPDRFPENGLDALNVVLKVVPPDYIPFAQFNSEDEQSAADFIKTYGPVWNALQYACNNPIKPETPEAAVTRVWLLEKEKIDIATAKDKAQLASPANRAIKQFTKEDRKKIKTQGHWLVEQDMQDIALLMGISKNRLGTLALATNDNEGIIDHLKFRLNDIKEKKLSIETPFYIMLSIAGNIQAQGSHWLPVKATVDKDEKLNLTIELSVNAGKPEQDAKRVLLETLGKKAGYTGVHVDVLPESKQSDGWSCGYRALAKMAQWDVQSNPKNSSYTQTMANILTQDEKTISSSLNNHVFDGIEKMLSGNVQKNSTSKMWTLLRTQNTSPSVDLSVSQTSVASNIDQASKQPFSVHHVKGLVEELLKISKVEPGWSVQTTQETGNPDRHTITPVQDETSLDNQLKLTADCSEKTVTGKLNKTALKDNLEQMAATILGSYMLATGGMPKSVSELNIVLKPADDTLEENLRNAIDVHIKHALEKISSVEPVSNLDNDEEISLDNKKSQSL